MNVFRNAVRNIFRKRPKSHIVLSDYGKSQCWLCGKKDIWKRLCAKCGAKYCAYCENPGAPLEKCQLCNTILKRLEDSHKSSLKSQNPSKSVLLSIKNQASFKKMLNLCSIARINFHRRVFSDSSDTQELD